MRRWIWIGALGVGIAGALFGVARMARASGYEHPKYTVATSYGAFEVRDYEPILEARVTVDGDFRAATSDGFRLLAGFIFGDNRSRAKVDMTAPVTSGPSERIAMTAPVTTAAQTAESLEAGRWTVTFAMPSRFTEETLPIPNDPRIEIALTPPERFAVRTFSGTARPERLARELAALLQGLDDAGLAPVGPPRVAQYDPPWIPGPMRTNEVMVKLGS